MNDFRPQVYMVHVLFLLDNVPAASATLDFPVI